MIQFHKASLSSPPHKRTAGTLSGMVETTASPNDKDLCHGYINNWSLMTGWNETSQLSEPESVICTPGVTSHNGCTSSPMSRVLMASCHGCHHKCPHKSIISNRGFIRPHKSPQITLSYHPNSFETSPQLELFTVELSSVPIVTHPQKPSQLYDAN